MRLQIADWAIDIACNEEAVAYLPNLKPFLRTTAKEQSPICRIDTGCTLEAAATVPTLTNFLDGKTVRIWLMPDHYRIALTFDNNAYTYRLQTDCQWTHIQTNWQTGNPDSYAALNDLIMLAFIYSTAFRRTILIHASCIAVNEEGIAFIGPSGIGKSTHSNLWLQHIPGSWLLNDDQPVLRLMPDNTIRAYGSPWSGKTPCYRNEKVRLKTVLFMEQSGENLAIGLGGIETFQKLLKATSLIGRDATSFAAISKTVADMAGIIPAYTLKNVPEKSAAHLSYTLFKSV